MKLMPRHAGLVCAIAFLASCDSTDDRITPPSVDLTLEVVSGNNQTGAAGAPLAQALVVQVKDRNGGPRGQQLLDFRVIEGGGTVSSATTMTDDDGMGDQEWTLGTRAGQPQKVEVRLLETGTGRPLATVAFSATTVAGPPALVAINAGNNQNAMAGTAVPVDPAVMVTDEYGNAAAQVAVTFAIAAGGGSVSGATVTTNNEGIATVGGWTLGASTGTKRLRATATGSGIEGNPVMFTATATAGPPPPPPPPAPPSRIVAHVGDNQTAAAGSAVLVAPAVRVTDQNGNAVPNVAVTFSVASGGGNVTGGAATTNAQGIATVGSWTLGFAAGTNTLAALATGTGIEGNPVTFTATGSAQSCDCWTSKAAMPTARSMVARGVINGKVYIAGGVDEGGVVTTLEVYDPASNTWTTKAPMPIELLGVAGTSLGDKLYVAGRSATEETAPLLVYDPATDTWALKAPMKSRGLLGMAAIDGLLYAVGGAHPFTDEQSTLEVYDPATDTWTTKTGMPTPRAGLGVAVVNGILYALGGYNHDGFVAAVEAYNPITDTWSTKAPMPTPRYGFGTAVVNGIIYTLGGAPIDVGTVEAYNAATDRWVGSVPLPTRRSWLVGAAPGGVIHAFGGQEGDFKLSRVDAFRP